jgi:hypothetical protein
MQHITAPHNDPAITSLRPVEAPSRAFTWRQELADLAESGCDLETLERFIAGVVGSALDSFELHREFQRDSGTAHWEYWRGRNSTIDDFRRQREEIRESYNL